MRPATKMNWVIKNIIYLFFAISLLIGCEKPECPRYIQIPTSVIPAKIDFHIGDTISIVSKFHREEVLGFDSEEKEIGFIDVSEFNWNPTITILKTDTLDQEGDTIKYFKLIDNPEYDYDFFIGPVEVSFFGGLYNYNNDSFDLSIKIIACKAGTYFLKQEGFKGSGEELNFSDKCPGIDVVDVWVKMNNIENYPGNNIVLLAESPYHYYNTAILENPIANFYHVGGYCFRVLP